MCVRQPSLHSYVLKNKFHEYYRNRKDDYKAGFVICLQCFSIALSTAAQIAVKTLLCASVVEFIDSYIKCKSLKASNIFRFTISLDR